MKVKDELWVHNLSTSDVMIGDLGVKVPVGKTVDVFKASHYMTAERVQKSLDSGSLYKRINEHKVLRLVTKKPKDAPLQRIREGNNVVHAKKTKTSVIVDTKDTGAVEGESFDFADYGVDMNANVSRVAEANAVFVKQKEDPYEAPAEGSPLAPKTSAGPAQRQSAVVMDHQAKMASHPMGKMAQTAVTPSESQPFIVSVPPKADPVNVVPPVAPKPEAIKQSDGTITVGEAQPARSIKTIAAKKTEEAAPKYDTKVATKTADGAIVMNLKEDAPVVTTETKAKPKKSSKKK